MPVNSSRPSSIKPLTFSQQVVQWYHLYGRKDLPWQQIGNDEIRPYYVWVSEIMLQQTQVVKVIDYFNRFIAAFPSLADLAGADEQQVLALWSGLGYYNRARNLHRTAQVCCAQHNGLLPADLNALMALPGIGRSTAAAIMSLAFDQAEPIMDGNVKRVFARHFLVSGDPNKSSTLKKFWSLALTYREHAEPAAYTQGLMDLGATLCTKHQPECDRCPIAVSCLARAQKVVADYPHKKRKVKQKQVDVYALLNLYDDQVGLVLRDQSSIWPNLWFLPTYSSEEALLLQHSGAKQRFSLTHKLTHRILHIHIYLVSQPINNIEVDMVDRQSLVDKPHPKALIHILNQHDNH